MALSELSKNRAAIYIRVSTHWQVDKDSLQVQERELIYYSEYVLGIKDYTIFKDAGYSAKNTERPDYQKMMSELRTGAYSHLLVWKIDRISRNLMDFCSMYSELKSMGIAFVSKNEQFDTSTAIGEAMLKIILVFAELERGMTSERVTAVMLSRANNGQWNGGRIPFGYTYDKSTDTFSICEPEAKTIKRMFHYYEEHQSLLQLANSLNSEGITTKSGNKWSATTVRLILTNPFYKGIYTYNIHSDGKATKKRDPSDWITVTDHHPPIIDDVLFDRIQFILQRNRRGMSTNERKYIHPFSGLMKCGICGQPMTATPSRPRASGFRPTSYGCSSRRRSLGCTNKYCNDLQFGSFILNYIGNLIKIQNAPPRNLTPESLEKLLLKGRNFRFVSGINRDALESVLSLINGNLYYTPKISETSASSESLKTQRRKYETALNRLKSLYLYSDSPISEKDYILEHEKISQKLSELDAKISVSSSISEKEFYSKASYILLEDAFSNQKYIDYEKYARSIDLNILKDFLHSIITSISIINGRVSSITFKNGITHIFNYSNNDETAD